MNTVVNKNPQCWATSTRKYTQHL